MIRKLVVAVDGSEHSQKALEFAAELAVKFGAGLHIVHVPQSVGEDRVMFLGGASVTVHATPRELEGAGHDLIEAAENIARLQGVSKLTSELPSGDPAEQVVRSAERFGADLLVLGSRGLGDFRGLLPGSVSYRVNQIAPCTCITVR